MATEVAPIVNEVDTDLTQKYQRFSHLLNDLAVLWRQRVENFEGFRAPSSLSWMFVSAAQVWGDHLAGKHTLDGEVLRAWESAVNEAGNILGASGVRRLKEPDPCMVAYAAGRGLQCADSGFDQLQLDFVGFAPDTTLSSIEDDNSLVQRREDGSWVYDYRLADSLSRNPYSICAVSANEGVINDAGRAGKIGKALIIGERCLFLLARYPEVVPPATLRGHTVVIERALNKATMLYPHLPNSSEDFPVAPEVDQIRLALYAA